MKIVYLITAYHKPNQLIRLVNRLNSPNSEFVIHYDKKGDDEDFEKVKIELNLPNIHFTKRIKVFWGHYSFVKAILKLIDYTLENIPDFDYAILLSGQHYPIKSNEYIKKFLKNSHGKFFLQSEKMPTSFWGTEVQDRIEKWHYKTFNKNYSFPPNDFPVILKRKFYKDFDPYGGSTWWIISKDIIEYITVFIKNNRSYSKFFKRVNISDEIFFQTLLSNSPYKDRRDNDNQLFEIWLKDTLTPSHPEILTKKDFSAIRGSSRLFARKFDEEIDSLILDLIDKEILYKNA